MKKILANDGIHPLGKNLLENAGFEVVTDKISQEQLPEKIANFDGLIVRSATNVNKEVLANSGKLKIIGRAGVGLDNIDLEVAQKAGIEVFNTASASSKAVASLAMAMILGISRNLHLSARTMLLEGCTNFAMLKKAYAGGFELEGKKLGIIGFGRIGQEMARLGVGMGMEILAYDAFYTPSTLDWNYGTNTFKISLKKYSLEDVLKLSDIISVHVPSQKDGALIGKDEFEILQKGVVLINTSRGGIIDENELLLGLESGKIRAAGLDVFENEPKPKEKLLAHPNVFASPHIGAETNEAQKRIGIELANNIIEFFKK